MTPAAATERATPSISSYGVARTTVAGTPLNAEDLRKIHACWRACNYLMLGMIYLQDMARHTDMWLIDTGPCGR
jgi:xylulose-5-phosphate/fructose-6-phosphate phosphoketolase